MKPISPRQTQTARVVSLADTSCSIPQAHLVHRSYPPGKLKTLLGILKKTLNVKDLTSVRVSLPAQLMEPM